MSNSILQRLDLWKSLKTNFLQTGCLLGEVYHCGVGEVDLHQGFLYRFGENLHAPQSAHFLYLPHTAQLPPKLWKNEFCMDCLSYCDILYMIVFMSWNINYKFCMHVHLIVGFCMSEISKSTLISYDFISRFCGINWFATSILLKEINIIAILVNYR